MFLKKSSTSCSNSLRHEIDNGINGFVCRLHHDLIRIERPKFDADLLWRPAKSQYLQVHLPKLVSKNEFVLASQYLQALARVGSLVVTGR